MRLICPHCMSGVTVSDDTAGKEAVCPNCGKSFPTPARYSAAVVPDASTPIAGAIEPVRASPHPEPPTPPAAMPAPPPGYVPPAPPPVPQLAASGFLAPPTATTDGLTPTGYTHSIGFTISPRVVVWLPAIFLTLALVLTFFPWVGTYFGGYPVYSQGPWRAMFGAAEKNAKLESVAPGETIGWTNKINTDWLMIPFLLLLILATALALADRGLRTFDLRKIPPLAKLWPVRHTIIAALSAATLALVLIQSLNGFGLERAVRQVVRENPTLVKEREAAQGEEAKLVRVENMAEQELVKFNLGRTLWMHLAVVCIALGALAAISIIVFDRRGSKPPPRILLHY